MDYEKRKTKLLSAFLVFVSICTLKGGIAEVIRCKETERQALLKFKKGLVDEYDVLSSWGRSECCKWRGVGCSNKTGHVISLHLNEETLDQWHALRGNLSNNMLEYMKTLHMSVTLHMPVTLHMHEETQYIDCVFNIGT
ncbi:receptor-like protein 12 [Dorcoceras hygrometricum]|uniref:Receptor-like protein 12 n=1 Tax=Dorcoceras hygrometricum TaxID=472368 RepID=A0A2Z7C149_9LAMI|nr:receptor-like protein 12 [Dorcoceras hygrometricum]